MCPLLGRHHRGLGAAGMCARFISQICFPSTSWLKWPSLQLPQASLSHRPALGLATPWPCSPIHPWQEEGACRDLMPCSQMQLHPQAKPQDGGTCVRASPGLRSLPLLGKKDTDSPCMCLPLAGLPSCPQRPSRVPLSRPVRS